MSANDNIGKFSLSKDADWQGLAKLVEECGEVLQIAGKLMATDGDPDHWSGENLAERLEEEVGDLEAALTFFIACNHHRHLNAGAVAARTRRKFQMFEEWS
jgi:NTP pyrophosphatase (non-canonical NTP hydrolase)